MDGIRMKVVIGNGIVCWDAVNVVEDFIWFAWAEQKMDCYWMALE